MGSSQGKERQVGGLNGLKFLLKKTARFLRKREICYMFLGGHSFFLGGERSVKKHLDVLLCLGSREYGSLGMYSELGFQPLVPDAANYVMETSILPVLDAESGFEIDFVFSNTIYTQHATSRACVEFSDDVPIRICSPEDLVIHKFIAGDATSIEEANRVLICHAEIDRDYILRWLRTFGYEFPIQDKALCEEDVTNVAT